MDSWPVERRGEMEEEERGREREEGWGFNVHTHISKDRLQRPVQSAREGREEGGEGEKEERQVAQLSGGRTHNFGRLCFLILRFQARRIP